MSELNEQRTDLNLAGNTHSKMYLFLYKVIDQNVINQSVTNRGENALTLSLLSVHKMFSFV